MLMWLFLCQADAIQEKIGYPDYILNDTALTLDYEGVSTEATSLMTLLSPWTIKG